MAGWQLSLITALMWGMLPIAMKELLGLIDPWTLTFYRFVIAGGFLLAWMLVRGGLPQLSQFNRRTSSVFTIGILMSSANYFLYQIALGYLGPQTAQVVIQLAPVLLLVMGVIILKEPFGRNQILGAIMLVVGLLVFFNQRLSELIDQLSDYSLGVWIMCLSAVAWAIYGVQQKILSRSFTSSQIMVVLYCSASLIFSVKAQPLMILDLSWWHLALLLFCGLNTLVAYGCFAEAVMRWEISKVSAVLAVVPLLTVGFMELLIWYAPGSLPSTDMNTLSYVGVVMVVLSSVIASYSRSR